ncbi:MAG: hypothetical protein ACOZAA_12005 [Pseudomonadota bacterium]
MPSRKSRTIRDFAAMLGSCLLACAIFIPAAGAAPEPPSLSKRGPDPEPTPPPLALEEVFVTSAPRKINEAQTIKEAYAKVKNGGVIFITQKSTDISNDGSTLVVTRPVTIALDPDLKTQMAIESDDDLARARVNAAADGLCLIMGQDERGDESGRRTPRDEVTIRDVEFVPNPGAAGDCIEVFSGRLFLDNVKMGSEDDAFTKGVVIQGGEVITNEKFRLKASKTGIDVRAGALEIADGAEITGAGSGDAPALDQSCASAPGKYSIGVFAGASADARVGDPVVILRSVTVSGFGFGVCAAGSGVMIDGASIRDAGVCVRAEQQIRIAGSRVGHCRTAAFISGSNGSDITDSKFYDSGVGAYIKNGSPPTFNANLFAFNQTAITLGAVDIKDKEIVQKFSGNSVLCNANAGKLPDWWRFKLANARKHNRPKICSGKKITGECGGLRGRLGVSPNSCGAVDLR